VSPLLDEHRHYLDDPGRLAAFRRALADVVRPGDVVVDLGAGTGILGLLACEAGAARVYAIDESGMLEVAREIAAANGRADRIVHLKGHSTEVSVPELADVVVADQIGYLGVEAGVIDSFVDARRRLLKAGGRLIPSRLDLWIAAIEHPKAEELIGFWDSAPAGMSVSPVRPLASNQVYPGPIDAAQFLGPPARLASLELGLEHDVITATVELKAHRPGTLHGLGGFFAASLSPSVVLTNSPAAADRIGRDQLFLPIDNPVSVKQGDRITASVLIRPDEVLYRWTVTVDGAGGVRTFRHSTWGGMVLAPAELKRTLPTHMPTLTARGEAQHAVLSWCDGSRTTAQIEDVAHAEFPSLFRTRAAAAAFVAKVLAKHAR
jgi:type I protein arginine methyltransferase